MRGFHLAIFCFFFMGQTCLATDPVLLMREDFSDERRHSVSPEEVQRALASAAERNKDVFTKRKLEDEERGKSRALVFTMIAFCLFAFLVCAGVMDCKTLWRQRRYQRVEEGSRKGL